MKEVIHTLVTIDFQDIEKTDWAKFRDAMLALDEGATLAKHEASTGEYLTSSEVQDPLIPFVMGWSSNGFLSSTGPNVGTLRIEKGYWEWLCREVEFPEAFAILSNEEDLKWDATCKWTLGFIAKLKEM